MPLEELRARIDAELAPVAEELNASAFDLLDRMIELKDQEAVGA